MNVLARTFVVGLLSQLSITGCLATLAEDNRSEFSLAPFCIQRPGFLQLFARKLHRD